VSRKRTVLFRPPQYNILKTAGSFFGYKHHEDSKSRWINFTSERKSARLEQLNRLNSSPEQKERLKRQHADPEYIAKRLERLKNLHQNPEFKAKRLERLKRQHADPEYIAKRLAALKVYNLSEKSREHLKALHENPEFQAKRLDHLNRLNSSSEHLEHLKQIHSIQSHQVSVLDTLTNQVTVYPSISAAARGIGCVDGTIRNALKILKEKGVTRLIKKIYSVKAM